MTIPSPAASRRLTRSIAAPTLVRSRPRRGAGGAVGGGEPLSVGERAPEPQLDLLRHGASTCPRRQPPRVADRRGGAQVGGAALARAVGRHRRPPPRRLPSAAQRF